MPETSSDLISRLLAGAAKTVTQSRSCWLVTSDATARPMGPIARRLDPESWTFSFVTDGRSHKAASLRRSRDIALIFEREAEDAFAELIGRAKLLEDRGEVARRWKSAYDAFFPTDEDKANATFVDIRIAAMNLWIRGVTPEPFGLQTTMVRRDAEGPWRIASP